MEWNEMKKYSFIFTFLVVFLSGINLISQVSQQWVARYNGPANSSDIGRAMVIDNNGNLYVTGSCYTGSTWNICTIKYNTSGSQQWAAIYPVGSSAFAIAVDAGGNVYVAGSVDPYPQDYLTIKYNSLGVQQWAVSYNGPGNQEDVINWIAVDNSGNVYVTGNSVSNLRNDYCTIKYSTSGVQLWIARFDGPLHLNDRPYQLRLDNLNNVYVTGFIDELSVNTKNFGTVKYNSSGVQQWVAIYNGTANGSDEARSIAVDNSGNVYVTGESKGNGSDFDIATIKYNLNGSQIWAARYNGPGNYLDRGNSIGVSQQGDIYVGGWSHGIGTSADFVTIKYNSSGIQQWEQRYNGPGNSIDYTSPPNSLAVDTSGNAYITGFSTGLSSGYDFCTIKYNSSGEQLWLSRYNGTGNGNDYGVVVAVDNLNNILAFGLSRDSATNDDYCLIKYSQVVSIQPISNEIPSSYSLIQNYPNPFNPSTKIRFSIAKSDNVELIIYDVLGKLVTELVNEELMRGVYEIDFDGGSLPSGIYYYKLNSESFSETKKMVLMK